MAVLRSLSDTSSPQTRVRLSSPEQILAAVPHLVGFAPERSVVVICLHVKQVGLTMRVDLDQLDNEMRAILVRRIAADRASGAVLLLFDPDPDPGAGRGRPGAAAMRSLMTAVERAGVEVREALGVRDGRFWSYLCRRHSCCPPEGRPVPEPGTAEHSLVTAPLVANGSAPLGSRRELQASVAPITGERLTTLEGMYDGVLASPPQPPIESWLGALALYLEPPPRTGRRLSMLDAATLIVAINDVPVRDTVISWTSSEARHAVLQLLHDLAPLALPPYEPELLTALGWAAFAAGDGALAGVALERALAAAPGHRLARMLDVAIQGGITPDQLNDFNRLPDGDLTSHLLPGLPNAASPDER